MTAFREIEPATTSMTTAWGASLDVLYRPETSDWNTLYSILVEDEYRLFTLKPKGDVLDIGAHIGGVSMAVRTLGCKAYSVEPVASNVKLLAANMAGNGFPFYVSEVAVTGRKTDGVFLPQGYDEHHRFIANSLDSKGKTSTQGVYVNSNTLEELLDKWSIDHLGLLKIDIEGGEWEVFEALRTPVLDKIDMIIGEVHCTGLNAGRTPADFFSILKEDFVDISEDLGYLPLTTKNPTNVQNFFLKHV